MNKSEICPEAPGESLVVARASHYLITGRGDGVVRVTAARLTPRPCRQVPMVGGAVVT